MEQGRISPPVLIQTCGQSGPMSLASLLSVIFITGTGTFRFSDGLIKKIRWVQRLEPYLPKARWPNY